MKDTDNRRIYRSEFLGIGIVLFSIILLGTFNIRMAKLKARDIQRKNDLKHIAAALNSYLYDFGEYPPSKDGKILACGDVQNLRPCAWGEDKVQDLTDPSYPPYINPLPRDPFLGASGWDYVYVSDTRNFVLFSSLENSKDDEYNEKVASKKLSCGRALCSFGVSSLSSPDLVIDENAATPSALPNVKQNKE